MGLSGVAVAMVLLVRVYDGSGMRAADVSVALGQARSVLADAGLDVRWIDCNGARDTDGAARGCDHPLAPSDVVLRIRALSPPADRPHVSMGTALVNETTGPLPSFSTVYADRVSSVARAAGSRVDVRLVLGWAVAHEIGHLLLNTSRHAARGLMRATWSQRELRRPAPGDWRFLEDEAAAMREAVALRARLAAAAQNALDDRAGGSRRLDERALRMHEGRERRPEQQ